MQQLEDGYIATKTLRQLLDDGIRHNGGLAQLAEDELRDVLDARATSARTAE
jgi:hypothetical protein